LFLVRAKSILYSGKAMATRSLVLDVWLAGLVIQFLLSIALVTRRLWGKFPVFSAYVLFTLVETLILLVLHKRQAYFYAYMMFETIAVLLGVALVYEIFVHLFSLHTALRRLARASFRVALVLLLLFAGAVIYSRMPIGKGGLLAALLLVEEAARILEVGLIAFLFVFASVFGLHWRQSVFGITLGLGISLVAKLVEVTVSPYVDIPTRDSLNLAQLACFDFGLLIWFAYMFMKERVPVVHEIPKRAQLEQWNQAVLELIHQ
jgi:hypothetical protein